MRRLGGPVRHVLFAALALAAAALVALNVLAWRGALDPSAPWGGLVSADPSPAPPAAPTAAFTASVPPVAHPAPRRARLTVVASRGDCWLDVRAGSADGPSVYAGTIAQGERRVFVGRRLWVSLGAASHVDLVLDGEPVDDVGSGTIALVATRDGVTRS